MAHARTIQNSEQVAALIEELVEGIASAVDGNSALGLVGIRRGGVALSKRIAQGLKKRGMLLEMGTVDISLYRDDAHLTWPRPSVGSTEIFFPVDGRHVVVVDDVFWTGRTARAAMDAVLDFGRPRRLWLATLAQRPGRELPMTPDFCPFSTTLSENEILKLRLREDGHEQDELVVLSRKKD